MAITTEAYGPTDRNPNRGLGDFQTGHLIGDGTSVAVAAGCGLIGTVHNNLAVAGSVSFHDAISGATLNAANRLLLVDTAAIGVKGETVIPFRQGLSVVTSAATNDVTFQLIGRATSSPRTFGVIGAAG